MKIIPCPLCWRRLWNTQFAFSIICTFYACVICGSAFSQEGKSARAASEPKKAPSEIAGDYLIQMNSDLDELSKAWSKKDREAAPQKRDALAQEFRRNLDLHRRKWAEKIFDLAKQHPTEPELVPLLANHVGNYSNEAQPSSEVLRALDLLKTHHMRSGDFVTVLDTLRSWRVIPETEQFLKAVAADHPDAAHRATALLNLAALYQWEVDDWRTTDAARNGYLREAERLLKEVIAKFSETKSPIDGSAIGPTAKGRLFELHHLTIGQSAPELKGADLSGTEINLADFRGKVVVLNFWHIH